jgi:protein phosphatase
MSGRPWGLSWGVATHVGRVRTNNEDSALAAPPLFVVADGMGGHAAGEVASALALEPFRSLQTDAVTAAALERSVSAADASIRAAADERPDLAGMGTTVVVLACTEGVGDAGAPASGPDVTVVHVGDSRAYGWHAGTLVRLTADHSVAGELLRAGDLVEAEARSHPARHVLTRALGTGAPARAEGTTMRASIGDRFLLCSDGLSDELEDGALAKVLAAGGDAESTANWLVAAALEQGGRDNVTVVVVDVVGGADDVPPRAESEDDTQPRRSSVTPDDGRTGA